MSRMLARLQRHRLQREADAAVARALHEAEPATRRPAVGRRTREEAELLRGIPVVGVQDGEGGAIRGTKPGHGCRSR